MANAAARVEIQDLIDSRPLSGTQLFVIVVCALSVVFDGFDLQVMALTVPALSKAWNLSPPQFSAALSASLFGMGLGAAFLAPLGDRYGRRAMLVLSLVAVGIGALACAAAQNVTQIAMFRFITGIGLGVSLPNAIALTADYAPRARRSAIVTAMYCNTATGALLAGLSAPWIVARLGWQGPFLVGGVLPIVAALLLLVTPESLKFLLHRRPGHPAIARILRRIAPAADPAAVYVRKVVFASSLGTVFEWYDFYLYGSLAAIIAKQFFSGVNDDHRLHLRAARLRRRLHRAAVRRAGVRPARRPGRAQAHLPVTILIMGALDLLVGCCRATPASAWRRRSPDRAAHAAGPRAGRRIRRRRHLCGRTCAAGKRGFYTSWIQTTATLGLFLSLLVILACRTLGEAFEVWGWRIPFLVSIVLLGDLGLHPLQLQESPAFQKMKEEGKTSKAPLTRILRPLANLKIVLLALFGGPPARRWSGTRASSMRCSS
jgi:MFS family permease